MRRMRDALMLLALGGVAGATLATAAVPAAGVLGPAVWGWAAMPVTRGATGEVRQIVRQPTATLAELEMHVTTLNPGLASHPPHHHPNEELVIIDRGEVETLSAGTWKRVGPGGVIFNASNSVHALRNIGAGPATYHVVNWRTAATPAE